MIPNYDYPASFDDEIDELEIIYSGYNRQTNEIYVQTNQGDITLQGDDYADLIFFVYDRCNVLYIVHWSGFKLEHKPVIL